MMRIHIHCLDQPLVRRAEGPCTRGNWPGPTVVSVTGDLDLSGIPALTKGVDRAIDDAVRTLIIDLTRVGFVAIAGVQALVDAQLRADANGLAVLLVCGRGPVLRALRVTGLLEQFRWFPSIRDAVDARGSELAAHAGLDIVIGE